MTQVISGANVSVWEFVSVVCSQKGTEAKQILKPFSGYRRALNKFSVHIVCMGARRIFPGVGKFTGVARIFSGSALFS